MNDENKNPENASASVETDGITADKTIAKRGRIISPYVWLLLLMVVIAAAFAILRPATNPAGDAVSETVPTVPIGTGAGISVVINQAERPMLGEEAYENPETGLFTETGIGDWVIPSQKSVITYVTDTLAPDKYGTATIISKDGYMLTCAHVISDGIRVRVLMSEDNYVDAEIVAVEKDSDLALLKVEADDLVPVIFGKSSEALLGEKVVCASAAGRYPDTLTFGNLTNLDRSIDNGFIEDKSVSMMQVSCFINPGASGGPVFNMYGQCIGIVDAKLSVGGFEGIGFILPADYAVAAAERMMGTTGRYPEDSGVFSEGADGFWLGGNSDEDPETGGFFAPETALDFSDVKAADTANKTTPTGVSSASYKAYLASANAEMVGQIAFDEDSYYFIEKTENDGARVYKRSFSNPSTDIHIASGNEYGFIHSLRVKDGELYYVSRYDTENDIEGTEGATPACLYAVPTDVSEPAEPRLVIKGVGDHYFLDGDEIIYTGDYMHGINGTFIYNTKTGEQKEIKADGLHMTYADGELLYTTGEKIEIYSIAEGKVIFSIPEPQMGIVSMIRYEDFIIYGYRYGKDNTKTVTGIGRFNIKTMNDEIVKELTSERNFPDGVSAEEYIENSYNRYVSESFNIYNGELVFFTYGMEYDKDLNYTGMTRNFYNLATLETYDLPTGKYGVLTENVRSDVPYNISPPFCELYSTPNGLYIYDNSVSPIKVKTE